MLSGSKLVVLMRWGLLTVIGILMTVSAGILFLCIPFLMASYFAVSIFQSVGFINALIGFSFLGYEHI